MNAAVGTSTAATAQRAGPATRTEGIAPAQPRGFSPRSAGEPGWVSPPDHAHPGRSPRPISKTPTGTASASPSKGRLLASTAKPTPRARPVTARGPPPATDTSRPAAPITNAPPSSATPPPQYTCDQSTVCGWTAASPPATTAHGTSPHASAAQ